ncbi:CinA family protein [Pantoea sp.]|uniref:CinA family protein n=1 Tax=Pantoea sp. TaxID=69393 RepID=UPI00345B9990
MDRYGAGGESETSLFYSSGFITYTNPTKHRALNVSMKILERYTAVSEAAVSEMA